MIETDVPGSGEAGWPTGFVRVETTGRSIVVFESSVTDPAAVLASAAGLGNVANSRDFQDQAVDVDGTDAGGAIYFAELGVAVVSADEDQVHLLRTASSARGAVISVSPELVYHVLDADPDYVQGYRDGVTDLSGRLGATEAGARAAASAAAAPPFADTAQFTWGLQATGVPSSPYSGKGVKVAVLDTGIDTTHPDLASVVTESKDFSGTGSTDDRVGHGTHVAATVAGSAPDPTASTRASHRARGSSTPRC